MDVEEAAAQDPQALRRHPIAIADGLKRADAAAAAAAAGPETAPALAKALLALYGAYRCLGAELTEIQPLAVTRAGRTPGGATGRHNVGVYESFTDGAGPTKTK